MRGFALFLALSFVGCTKPPALPTLPSNSSTTPVVLDDSLDVADFRGLFDSMNRGGRLESLRPYWQNATDAELRALADLASRYLYEEAHHRDGLPRLLGARTAERGFSQWKSALEAWAKEPAFVDESRALVSATTVEGFPELLKRDSGLLDSRWAKWLDRARDDYREIEIHPSESRTSGRALVQELQALALSASFREKTSELGEQALKHDPLLPLIKALRAFREDGKGGETGIAFEGFGYGLAGLVSRKAEIGNKNVFATLLQFVQASDATPDGLLTTIQERIRKEPASLMPFVAAANELVPKALFGYFKERLERPRPRGGNYDRAYWLALGRRPVGGPPTPESIDLFIAVRESIERITDLSHAPMIPDFFLFNLPIHLNGYVLTKWGEAFARANVARWEKLSNEEFSRKLWEGEATGIELEIPLLTTKRAAPTFSESHEKEMKAFGGLDEFVDELVGLAGRDGYGTFHYAFPRLSEKGSFADLWSRAFEQCHKQRAFADAGAVVRAAVYGLTRSTVAGAPTVLDRLERVNLMDTFNLAVGALADPTWVSLREVLFTDLGIGRLSPSKRALILDFYEQKQPLKRRADVLLNTIQTIYDFDQQLGRLPSPLTVYRKWAGAFPIQSVHGLTAVFRFAGDSELVDGSFGPDGSFTARFPALHGLLREGRPAARALHALSWLNESDGEDFRRLLLGAFTTFGWREHFDFFAAWVKKSPAGVASLFDRARKSESRLLPSESTLSSSGRAWTQRFVSRGDHFIVWNYLRRHASPRSVLDVSAQLKALSRKGELAEAFRLLERIQNERIRLLARTFAEWDRSGELVAFLEALETLVASSVPSP